MEKKFDVIVIGAGVAGLAATMYSARLGLKTVCFGYSSGTELSVGGVITTTDTVENYPGFVKLTGEELADKIRKHALEYELASIKEEKVKKVQKKGKEFKIITDKGEYESKTVIFATGTKWRKLEVKGAVELENKGVAYCALCDAPLYKNKIVSVVGGSDTAAKDALLLSKYAKKVYIIYRGEKIKAEPINVKRVEENEKIEVLTNTNVIEVVGKDRVERVIIDKSYNGKKEIVVDGVFVAIGHIVISDLAKELGVKLNDKGEIIINHKNSETSMEGVFAAGDVSDKPFKQAITGVAEGCTAAYSASEYIKKEGLDY